ncbi:MAG TPA: ABC transporter permease [Thermoanaerobaculia bacterium]|nr:ABC transporter permease [Thermoanaerobaculia bacterium]
MSRALSTTVLRRLGRAPAFTLTAVVTLALGIGANVAIFSVIRGVLLEPLPYPDQERLVAVWHTAPGLGFEEVNQSAATHLTYLEQGRAFDGLALWNQATVTVTGLDTPEEVAGIRASPSYLAMLGAKPMLGRLFGDAEEAPDAPLAVVLSHAYWQARLGADPDIVGTTLRLDGRPREVIGVLAPGFRPPHQEPALYLPQTIDRTQVFMGQFNYTGLGRLAPGVTLEQANAEVDRLIPVAAETFAGGLTRQMLEEARFGAALRTLRDDVVGDVGEVLWVLMGTVGLVLLIACANVANLFLVRAEGRDREIAVRLAMGAGRVDVARHFLTESLALSVAGGGLGLALAHGVLKLLVGLGAGRLPRLHEIGIDGAVVAFTVGVSALTALLFGLLPVLRVGGRQWTSALKEGGRGGSVGRGRHRVRRLLVATQIALALVLLIGSGLMLRSFAALRHVAPGFTDSSTVQAVRIGVPGAEVEDAVDLAALYESVAADLAALPGVESVGFSSALPLDGEQSADAVAIEDFPTPEGQLPPVHVFLFVSPGFFATIGNPVLAGRELEWGDIHDRRPVAVVSANFAREYWGEPSAAIGKRLGTTAGSLDQYAWREIVGVVSDLHHHGLDHEPPTIVYWPHAQAEFWGATGDQLWVPRSVGFALRSPRAGSSDLVAEIQRAIWERNPNLPLVDVQTLEDLERKSLARTSFTILMLALAASAALLLGAIGLYGVITYIVAQRTREIGVRMALGASRRSVSRQVVSQGLAMALAGIVAGLLAALGLTRLMGALLFGVESTDPLTYAATAVALAGIATLSSWLAARRATRVDPVVALRAE